MKPTLCARYGALLFIALFSFSPLFAKKKVVDSAAYQEALQKAIIDSVNNSIKYQEGKVDIDGIAELSIPAGYKFITPTSASYIVHDLWNNPRGDSILGMIVKSDYKATDGGQWAFVVTFEDDGYVKDEDADKINYDDMLKEIQKSEEENNKSRVAAGYPPIHLTAWAAKPYYDKTNKVLHWAKNLQFGTGSDIEQVLNYDVRILGRKGVLSLNAVGTQDQLADINAHIPDVIKIAQFKSGHKYSDFNPSVDKIAAYTIGGLIAGKLIAKTGILVLLLKYIKIILLALFGGFAAMKKKISGWFSKKKDDDYTDYTSYPAAEEPAQIAEHTEPTTTFPEDRNTPIDEHNPGNKES